MNFLKKAYQLESRFLKRTVTIDLVDFEHNITESTELLIVNDGQDISSLLPYGKIRDQMINREINPVLVIAVHALESRRTAEYGISNEPDYRGRGALAGNYEHFIINELLPWVSKLTGHRHQALHTAFAGCSLGGLSAFDIAISNPSHFSKAGVFSGSLWWRSKSYEDGYTQDDRLIFKKLRNQTVPAGFSCWLMAGTNDEKNDRNRNGIIDSVDDTLDLFDLLSEVIPGNVHLNIVENGRHDLPTWSAQFPGFMNTTFSRS